MNVDHLNTGLGQNFLLDDFRGKKSDFGSGGGGDEKKKAMKMTS